MPKVKFTPAKGLVTESGTTGIGLGYSLIADGDTLSGNTHGVGLHTIAVSGTDTVTLPTAGVSAGTVHIIIVASAASTPKVTITNGSISAQAVAAGDMFICVYTGSAWVVGKSVA